MSTEVTVTDLEQAIAEGALVLDVREPAEYAEGHVPGAQLMPLGVVPVRFHELPTPGPVYVICRTGARSWNAALILSRVAGIDARSVAGGTEAWAQGGRPLSRGRAA